MVVVSSSSSYPQQGEANMPSSPILNLGLNGWKQIQDQLEAQKWPDEMYSLWEDHRNVSSQNENTTVSYEYQQRHLLHKASPNEEQGELQILNIDWDNIDDIMKSAYWGFQDDRKHNNHHYRQADPSSKHRHKSRHKKKHRHDHDAEEFTDALRIPTDPGPFTKIQLNQEARYGYEMDLKMPLHPPRRKEDPFATSLDWSTTNNPDGVNLVHDPFNQGNCGACWASAAAGTVEANVARRAARNIFLDIVGQYRHSAKIRLDPNPSNWTNIQHMAYETAQVVERRTFAEAHLSVQELVDCDKAQDRGCTGGNPLLAFYFIRKHGLAKWSDYSYKGFEDVCNAKEVAKPIATVESWGLLPKDYEDMIELVLRYMGPVAVGFNGSSERFISYKGGIFEDPDCSQHANHAMLIVGYGEEEVPAEEGPDSRVVRYWKVRNSWGSSWGEGGYVRIKRGDGKKGTKGVCGIARSPSLALGGTLVPDRGDSPRSRFNPKQKSRYPKSKHGKLYRNRAGFCEDRLGETIFYDGCSLVEQSYQEHTAAFMGVVAVLCALVLAVWPLTTQCRTRATRRRKYVRRSSLVLDEGIQNAPQLFVAYERRRSSIRERSIDFDNGGVDPESPDGEYTALLSPASRASYGSARISAISESTRSL